MSGKAVLKITKNMFGEGTKEYTEICVFIKDQESKGFFRFRPIYHINKRRLKFRLISIDHPILSRGRSLHLTQYYRR